MSMNKSPSIHSLPCIVDLDIGGFRGAKVDSDLPNVTFAHPGVS